MKQGLKEFLIKESESVQQFDIVELEKYLNLYRKGMWMLPEFFTLKFGVSDVDATHLLMKLKSNGFVKGYYSKICPGCGKVVRSEKSEQESVCPYCHKIVDIPTNTFVMYQVQ